jgi:hypothetical protein
MGCQLLKNEIAKPAVGTKAADHFQGFGTSRERL